MRFTVDVLDWQYAPVDTQRLRLMPANYSSQAVGGPLEARIDVQGDALTCWSVLSWLRYYVIIRNEHHTPVWWGIVTGAEVQTPASKVGVTLADMRNRIVVDYTYDDAAGVPQSAETDWAQDADSVARYGTHEERVSLADAPQAMAESKRDAWLAQVKRPVASIEVGEGEASATLTCAGLWSALEWKYYANDRGRHLYDETEDIEHILGWSLTSNVIGFNGSAIHDRDARLSTLLHGGQVIVSGSTSNDGLLIINQPSDDAAVVYGPKTTISFDPNDDIMDSDNGLGVFRAEEFIQVSGSGANDGYYRVKTTGSARIEVTDGAAIIASESAGASVTLRQGHMATVDESVTLERPGASITIGAVGSTIAQSFLMPSTWSVYEVAIRAKRVGTPGDNLICSIYSGATPTTLLANATVTGSGLAEEMAWVTFTFGSPPSLTGGTTYWLVIARGGAHDYANHYRIGLNSEKGYTSGALKIYWISSWIDRWEDADMPFQIWGQEQTSYQVDTILRDAGQFITDVMVVGASGVWKRQYRDGTRRANAEVEELMEAGNSSSRRYVATVTPERVALVKAEPDANDYGAVYSATTGKLRHAAGGPWPPGVLPVGDWVHLVDVPPLVGITLESLSPFFVERADYDVAGDRLTLEPRGRMLPWEL